MEEEDLFNQDYVEVERVLEKSITEDPQTDEEVIHYLGRLICSVRGTLASNLPQFTTHICNALLSP